LEKVGVVENVGKRSMGKDEPPVGGKGGVEFPYILLEGRVKWEGSTKGREVSKGEGRGWSPTEDPL